MDHLRIRGLTLILLVVGLLDLGCETNKITGRNQIQTISDQEAAEISSQAYAKVLMEARRARALNTSPFALQRVRTITQRLVVQATHFRRDSGSWEWEVNILDIEEVNAWCMAGGKMAIYSGMLQRLNPTDDEIAQVMGHEIAHALLSHQSERLSRHQIQQAGMKVGVLLAALAGHDVQRISGLTDTVATVGLQLPNSRQAEDEADRIGIELAARSGFAPGAAVSLWEKVMRLGRDRLSAWLSTHPDPHERLETIRREATRNEYTYRAALRDR